MENLKIKVSNTIEKYSGYELDMDIDVFIDMLKDIKGRFEKQYDNVYIEGDYEYDNLRRFYLLIKGERHKTDEEYKLRTNKNKQYEDEIREREIAQLKALQKKYGKDV